jgi:uncharacterized protein (DUF1800 family)
MIFHLSKLKRLSAAVLSLALTFSQLPKSQAAVPMLDLNGNGISDVWEWLYHAQGVAPGDDPDGDGYSNLQEAIAGTDPFNPLSFPQITTGTFQQTNFSITLPCYLGKQYSLQSSDASWTNVWVTETNVVARSGTNITLTATATNTARFYRVAISDVDSDGDGLNDWEEYQLGLDPLNPNSNGQPDGNGNALGDYAYAASLMAQQNVITVTASVPATTQPNFGQAATSSGLFTITRGGFPLNSISVSIDVGGPGPGYGVEGVDFQSIPYSVTIPAGANSVTVAVTPLANTNLQAPVLAQLLLLPGENYTVGNSDVANVVVYPSPSPNGTGLLGHYYTNSSVTYTNAANFNPTNLFLTRVDPTINFVWSNGSVPNLSNGLYSVRWTGEIQPQFSETYVFDVKSDDGCMLWVNDQLLINKWQAQSVTDWTNSITLQAGTRYDIRLDYLQAGASAQAHLYWYSPSQPETIIPTTALYPTNTFVKNVTNAAAVITSPLSAVAFLGQPFSFQVTAANNPLGFTAVGVPWGLSFNSSNGVISGIPAIVGNFNVWLTASNNAGVGASIVTINVLDTPSSIVQEIWTNVPGTNISAIPLTTPANLTNVLGSLQGATGYGSNYAERVRGYFTAPVTGNYYFWVAGSDSVQLGISDDNNPVNNVLRATAGGTPPLQYNLQPGQQSPWLSLVAGQPYFIQVLHKVGTNPGDNWSVGYMQDPTGTNVAPAGPVPSYLLTRYYPPFPASIPGTLYTANLLALPGVASQGTGTATLRVNGAGTQATLDFQVSNLKGVISGEAINSDPYLSDPAELIFDISAATPQADGSYLWNFTPMGPLAVADIAEIIREGKASILIQTSAYPNGEINGYFTAVDGSQTFTPPPTPPSWADDSGTTNGAVRFLNQATFGASPTDIAAVQSMGYSNWLANQFSLPVTHHLPYVLANPNADPTDPYQSYLTFAAWWKNSVTAPDQLRQRVAFALSEILVISENGALVNHATALSSYYDTLLDNAFGNFRTLLEKVTLHPAMGIYLNMLGNTAGSEITGLHADENYAREIQQLFSIGLNREWPDGTLILNGDGNLVPTYNQNVIMGFASVFTGWTYYQSNQANGRLPVNFYPPANYTNSMVLVPTHHELGTKLLLDNVVLPAAQGSNANSTLTNFDYYCSQDLEKALNCIFANQNVGPFICRELIQRLVTSNPSRDYVYRVTQVFNDDGTGVRGNLQAVVQAILLDYEARSPQLIAQPDYGKQKEAFLRVTSLARAFPAPQPFSGNYSQTTNQTISVVTPAPHRLASGDTVFLTFTDTSGNPAPSKQSYGVTVQTPTNFTVTAPQLLVGSYVQSNGIITPSLSGNGLASNNPVYLTFTTGGASNGLYQITSIIDSSHFTVTTTDLVTRAGTCLLGKLATGGYSQTGTTITLSTAGIHGLVAGNSVYIHFTSGTAASGTYTVVSVPDPTHFTVTAGASANQANNSLSIYSLVAPPLMRSGTVTIQEDTWNMGYTDAGGAASLMETPMRSPTVFNYYYPSYKFPGPLASAGLTTPEFQLTTATGVSSQMNFMEAGLLNNTGNTNGLSSFTSGNGNIVIDFGPWMTTNYTANSGIPGLVSTLSSLLAAGQVSATAQADIVNYVASTNFPYSTPPTYTQMRDRVRAVVHMVASSPDYVIQK